MKPGTKAKVRKAKNNDDLATRLMQIDVKIANARTDAHTPYMVTHKKKQFVALAKVRKLEDMRKSMVKEAAQ